MSTKDCGQVVAALCGHIHFSRHKLSALDKFFSSVRVSVLMREWKCDVSDWNTRCGSFLTTKWMRRIPSHVPTLLAGARLYNNAGLFYGPFLCVCLFPRNWTLCTEQRENDACQLSEGVVVWLLLLSVSACVLFVCLGFSLPPLLLSPPPPTLSPTWKDSHRGGIKKKLCFSSVCACMCVCVCVPQIRLRGRQPRRSIIEVWRRFSVASLHPRPQQWPMNRALLASW